MRHAYGPSKPFKFPPEHSDDLEVYYILVSRRDAENMKKVNSIDDVLLYYPLFIPMMITFLGPSIGVVLSDDDGSTIIVQQST